MIHNYSYKFRGETPEKDMYKLKALVESKLKKIDIPSARLLEIEGDYMVGGSLYRLGSCRYTLKDKLARVIFVKTG